MNAQTTHFLPRITLTTCLSLALSLAGLTEAFAETASQHFTVIVPARAEVVTPPTNLIVDAIGEGEQELPPQRWNLGSTSTSGMVAEFSVAESFTHRQLPDAKSDVGLRVRVAETMGGGHWSTGTGIDSTDHSRGDERASVTVISTAGGSAAVDLEMEFANAADLPTGTYGTTVFCTVATP